MIHQEKEPETLIQDKAPESPIQPTEDEKDDHEYPPLWEAILLTATLFCSFFCCALDQTILATAIPRITDEFQSLDDIGWYSGSFLLTMCATKMVWGKMYLFYPAKWAFLSGLFLFEVGSLICGAAPSSVALIIGRCIAGIGASGIDSGAIIIVLYIAPVRKRPIFISCLGSVRGITSVAGPPLGGVFTDHATWRWCFYINLPFGAVTLIGIFIFLSPKTPSMSHLNFRQKAQRMDILGTLCFIPGVVALLLAIQWGGSDFAWNSWRIILLFTLAGVLLFSFGVIQVFSPEDRATIPLRVLRDRNILGGLWYVSCLFGALFVMIYYLPIWFQSIKNVSATNSGLMLLPTELGMVIFSLIGATLVTVTGYYTPFIVISPVLFSIGTGLLSTLTPTSGTASWLGYQILMSAGAGLGAQNAYMVAQVGIPPSDSIMAITMISFVQLLAGAVMLAVSESVFHRYLGAEMAGVDGLDGQVVTGASVDWEKVPGDLVGDVLSGYNRAIVRTFYIAVVLGAVAFLGTVVLEWKSVKAGKGEGRIHPTDSPNITEPSPPHSLPPEEP
ncbi:major facilitator superfamily transporter [Aspergillus steynii IBT 23096]|uniref:Major facilitator superfamily transporter n=1 Tax=Aspergillus steynii IBT 23096 TaxID=1392250 RepID=A0A2I2G886_9EURO|nr:major facilitator superfamily transporter [Aspergillus steynii IBT 23096]PLB49099.1 major facilitator superfamily transporter [Aspergillus steynii IBT 23096]